MTSSVATRLELPEDLLDKYEALAQSDGVSLDQAVATHLRKVASGAGSKKPIVLTDADRQALEGLLGKNFSSASELVDAITMSVTVSIGGLAVSLSPKLLARLETRAIGVPFSDYLAATVVRLLEQEVGMR